MKLQISRSLLMVGIVALFSVTMISCKKKATDASIKTAIEAVLKADPTFAGTMIDVKDGVASITGEFKDEMVKAACEKAVAAVKGVKSVVNNSTVAAAFTPPVIVADDPLSSAVNDALKAFPGVSATVKEGIISLTGKISKMDRQKLVMFLQSLKPKKLDLSGLINN